MIHVISTKVLLNLFVGTEPGDIHTLLEESGLRLKKRVGLMTNIMMGVGMVWKMGVEMVWKMGVGMAWKMGPGIV